MRLACTGPPMGAFISASSQEFYQNLRIYDFLAKTADPICFRINQHNEAYPSPGRESVTNFQNRYLVPKSSASSGPQGSLPAPAGQKSQASFAELCELSNVLRRPPGEIEGGGEKSRGGEPHREAACSCRRSERRVRLLTKPHRDGRGRTSSLLCRLVSRCLMPCLPASPQTSCAPPLPLPLLLLLFFFSSFSSSSLISRWAANSVTRKSSKTVADSKAKKGNGERRKVAKCEFRFRWEKEGKGCIMKCTFCEMMWCFTADLTDHP